MKFIKSIINFFIMKKFKFIPEESFMLQILIDSHPFYNPTEGWDNFIGMEQSVDFIFKEVVEPLSGDWK